MCNASLIDSHENGGYYVSLVQRRLETSFFLSFFLSIYLSPAWPMRHVNDLRSAWHHPIITIAGQISWRAQRLIVEKEKNEFREEKTEADFTDKKEKQILIFSSTSFFLFAILIRSLFFFPFCWNFFHEFSFAMGESSTGMIYRHMRERYI